MVREIANKKHFLIATTDHEDSIDNFVFESCVEIINNKLLDLKKLKFAYPLLQIIYPLNEEKPFKNKLNISNEYNKKYISTIQDRRALSWNFVGFLSTSQADVVILLRGSKNTQLIGCAHAIDGKLIIPIRYFGGAAENVFKFMKQMFNGSEVEKISLSEDELDKVGDRETKTEDIIRICEINYKKNNQIQPQINRMILTFFNGTILITSIILLLLLF